MRRVPSKHRNRSIRRQKEHGALGRLALLLICGLVLASGFVYAGVQHFGALRLGYETEKLRTDLEKVLENQKRLMMEREAAASPIRLEQAARRLGMQPIMPAQIDPLRQRSDTPELKAAPASQRIQTPLVKQTAASKVVALRSAKVVSSSVLKQAASVKPTSLKIQEKPKTSKPSSDRKKSR